MKKHLSSDARLAIVRAKESGRTNRQIAEELDVSHTTVGRIWCIYSEFKLTERKPGSGRPRKSTEREDRAMIRIVRNDPRKNATDVKKYAEEHLHLERTDSVYAMANCLPVDQQESHWYHKKTGRPGWLLPDGSNIGQSPTGKKCYGLMKANSICFHQMASDMCGDHKDSDTTRDTWSQLSNMAVGVLLFGVNIWKCEILHCNLKVSF